MSGFAGWIGAGGASIRRDAVDAMAAALAQRGPDATGLWIDGPAALVHTLFRTTEESARERQPLSADGRFHLVGDARLDARGELIASLGREGRPIAPGSPDVDLVLQAWLVWRDDAVQHLRGDFSFAVWDAGERRLFGARDQFGVRPFYYAPAAGGLVFGNQLAALRRHPDVDHAPDDEAMVDTLVFGQFENPASTAFAGIKRLPGGHTLTWHAGRTDVRRYWHGLPERPIRFARHHDYVERYRELLARAVADRLRTAPVAVAMTGGLDSSSIAASAARLYADRGVPNAVQAHTIVYDRLIPDRERHFAGLAARHIGVPITFAVADDRPVYERVADPARQPPEPVDDPFRAMLVDFYQAIARQARVLLMGLDGDTFLCEIASDYLLARLRRAEFGEYARGVVDYVRTRRSLPPHRVRSTIRRLIGRERIDVETTLPAWIDPATVRRFDLEARWAARLRSIRRPVQGWPLRVRIASVLASPIWASMFDQHDTEALGATLEARFPFADLELADFLANIPAVPWCIDKYIARQAMRDWLPREVVARPKAPLAGDTVRARLQQGDRLPWIKAFRPHPCLGRYVNLAALHEICNREPPAIAVSVDTRPLMLNEWLWYHFPRS